MERKLNEYFDGAIMPDDCVTRIEKSLETQTIRPSRKIIPLRRTLTIAAVLMCFCILTVCGIGNLNEGKNLPTESIELSRWNAYHKLFGLETRSREEIAAKEAQKEAWENRQNQAKKTARPLAEVRNERLYFVACGEDIDITDKCSPDQVFLYTYTDDLGFLHYIGIGGTPDRWGYSEVIFDTLNTNVPSGGWSGGGGGGYWNGEADEPYGWYVQFKELTGHPWPV